MAITKKTGPGPKKKAGMSAMDKFGTRMKATAIKAMGKIPGEPTANDQNILMNDKNLAKNRANKSKVEANKSKVAENKKKVKMNAAPAKTKGSYSLGDKVYTRLKATAIKGMGNIAGPLTSGDKNILKNDKNLAKNRANKSKVEANKSKVAENKQKVKVNAIKVKYKMK